MPFLQVVSYLIPMFLLSWQLTLCLLAVNSVMMAIELLLLKSCALRQQRTVGSKYCYDEPAVGHVAGNGAGEDVSAGGEPWRSFGRESPL